MTQTLKRALLAVAGALVLASCGGGGGGILGGYTSLPVQGAIQGLTSNGLVLINNGGDPIAPPANAATYSFPTQVEIGKTYQVAIRTQPVNQTCRINAAADAAGNMLPDTAGRTVEIFVPVICTQNSYKLGGTVTGATTEGLVLTNGPDQVKVPANATAFTFPTPVLAQAVYGVAVLSNPAGKTCTVINGTAVMGSADVTNVRVTCQ